MIEIYIDGSCSGNPGPGGWAIWISDNEYKTGCDPDTTNNRMELKAFIEGYKYSLNQDVKDCIIYTDSIYVYKGVTEWMSKWELDNWKSASRKDVKNIDLWRKVLKLKKVKHYNEIFIEKVKAHSGVLGNDKADALAKNAIE